MEFPKEKIEFAKREIKSKFLPDQKLLYLSLVGNAIFGWGTPEFPQEIYGLFLAKNFWDKVYMHLPGFYITLFNLIHLLEHEFSTPRNIEFFAKCALNFANPIYCDKKFDTRPILSFYRPEVLLKKSDLYFDFTYFPFSIDGLLRYYHFLLGQIYYLKTRKVELDIFKLAKKCSFKSRMISRLRDLFLKSAGRGESSFLSEREIKEIRQDFEKLSQNLQKLKKKLPDVKIDYLEFERWKEKIKRVYKI